MLAFGDMPNDLPMLAWAGTPYAMANAHASVLAAVELHAPSNDEDGVASVLAGLFQL
jgi:hydroxymethylpyrimidine pyrophosphatase-like HAD family hydrolase